MRGKDGGGCREYGSFEKPRRLRWAYGAQNPEKGVAEILKHNYTTSRAIIEVEAFSQQFTPCS